MKRILITGASRGIGYELCKQLLKEEHQIVATYRSEKTAGPLFELEDRSKNLLCLSMDVKSSASVHSAAEEISEKFPFLDQVFNNAGILDWSPLGQVSAESFL